MWKLSTKWTLLLLLTIPTIIKPTRLNVANSTDKDQLNDDDTKLYNTTLNVNRTMINDSNIKNNQTNDNYNFTNDKANIGNIKEQHIYLPYTTTTDAATISTKTIQAEETTSTKAATTTILTTANATTRIINNTESYGRIKTLKYEHSSVLKASHRSDFLIDVPERKEIDEAIEYGLKMMNDLYFVKEPSLYEMGLYLREDEPATKVAAFNAPNEQATLLAKYGYATVEASAKLAKTFFNENGRQSNPNVFPQLRAEFLLDQCPLRGLPKCQTASKRYRTADGTCNNLENPWYGASMLPMQRFLQPHYHDFVQSPRQSVLGGPLPSPRTISTAIHNDRNNEIPSITMMFMQWGQFLDHDITSTAQARSFNGSVPRCCHPSGRSFLPPELTHPECMPIFVPEDDWFYGKFGIGCLEFIRSAPSTRIDCELGYREQINQVTAYIDGSTIYGSDLRRSESLRTFRKGKLLYGRPRNQGPLNPPDPPGNELCRMGALTSACFNSGDGRSNEQPGLTAFHTIWLRYHNKLAETLSIVNSHWSDEKIYQETRRIVGALIQHITYREFLPILLGREVMNLFDLSLLRTGYYKGYDKDINPSPANSFGAAAFRFGHSLVQNSYMRGDTFHRMLVNNVSLHEEPANVDNIWTPGSLDRLLIGFTNQGIQRRDEFICEELTNHLFQSPNNNNDGFGMDLAAINIQRGRDHGIPSFTMWREPCGLKPIRNWNDLSEILPKFTINKLRSIYNHVDDIDLYTAGLAEKPVRGGIVGPTFACIIAQQFSNLREGDRFWYENGGFESSFTPAQLQQIRKISFGHVLCQTTNEIDTIQPYVFLSADDTLNVRTSCINPLIDNFDVTPWIQKFPRENDEPIQERVLVSLDDENDYGDESKEETDKDFIKEFTDGKDNFDKFTLFGDINNSKKVLQTDKDEEYDYDKDDGREHEDKHTINEYEDDNGDSDYYSNDEDVNKEYDDEDVDKGPHNLDDLESRKKTHRRRKRPKPMKNNDKQQTKRRKTTTKRPTIYYVKKPYDLVDAIKIKLQNISAATIAVTNNKRRPSVSVSKQPYFHTTKKPMKIIPLNEYQNFYNKDQFYFRPTESYGKPNDVTYLMGHVTKTTNIPKDYNLNININYVIPSTTTMTGLIDDKPIYDRYEYLTKRPEQLAHNTGQPIRVTSQPVLISGFYATTNRPKPITNHYFYDRHPTTSHPFTDRYFTLQFDKYSTIKNDNYDKYPTIETDKYHSVENNKHPIYPTINNHKHSSIKYDRRPVLITTVNNKYPTTHQTDSYPSNSINYVTITTKRKYSTTADYFNRYTTTTTTKRPYPIRPLNDGLYGPVYTTKRPYDDNFMYLIQTDRTKRPQHYYGTKRPIYHDNTYDTDMTLIIDANHKDSLNQIYKQVINSQDFYKRPSFSNIISPITTTTTTYRPDESLDYPDQGEKNFVKISSVKGGVINVKLTQEGKEGELILDENDDKEEADLLKIDVIPSEIKSDDWLLYNESDEIIEQIQLPNVNQNVSCSDELPSPINQK